MATSSEAPKKNNTLHIWGNERTMNINHLILTNITTSNYFKNDLLKLKTFHEIVDEIYNQVTHLEPWEKGSRKLAGQTGMCGGVRGVGAGGIVSSAFTLLYKLFTLRLTRKQLNNLLNHPDSPYIRGLGFMYIRYCQEPADLWDWFESYLDDEEEIDLKAGGGRVMTMGEMCQMMLSKLEWFGTLFPRIPIPIQKDIERRLREYTSNESQSQRREKSDELDWGEAGRLGKFRSERHCSDEEEPRDRDAHHRSHSPECASRRGRSRSPRDRRRDRSPERYEKHARKRKSSSTEDSSSRRRQRQRSPPRSDRQERRRRQRSSSSRESEDRSRSRRHKHQKRRIEHSDSSEKGDRYKSHSYHKHRKDHDERHYKYSGGESSSS